VFFFASFSLLSEFDYDNVFRSWQRFHFSAWVCYHGVFFSVSGFFVCFFAGGIWIGLRWRFFPLFCGGVWPRGGFIAFGEFLFGLVDLGRFFRLCLLMNLQVVFRFLEVFPLLIFSFSVHFRFWFVSPFLLRFWLFLIVFIGDVYVFAFVTLFLISSFCNKSKLIWHFR